MSQAGTTLNRRSLMKWSGALGGSAALVGVAGLREHGRAAATPGVTEMDTIWSACTVNCGCGCPLRMQVADGAITRVLPDNTGTNEVGSHNILPCVRGRSIRHSIYNPDRLKVPLRRKPGTKRGEGHWEEITWDEAFDMFAENYRRILDTYGPESVLEMYGSGIARGAVRTSYYTYNGIVGRLMNVLGGHLGMYGDYSTGCISESLRLTYGGWQDTNSSDDLANTKLLVLWGYSPLETRMSGGSEVFYVSKLHKEHGFKVIAIDPRQSDTVSLLADEWLAPRPGTDAALVAGMAHVMITEDLHDQAFLDTHCVGFDEEHMPPEAPPNASYKSYVMGLGADGVEKTPAWASAITGVPEAQIVQVAREIATTKPVAIQQGWGPQRQANGEYTARAIFTLNAMIGSVGILGGGTGANPGSAYLPIMSPIRNTVNPVEAKISHFTWPEAIAHGEEMTATKNGVRGADKLSTSVKMVFCYGTNTLVNQHSDIFATTKLLQDDSKCEFIVNIDTQMTSSARFSDLVLPGTTTAEEDDISNQGLSANMSYAIYSSRVIEPLFESKSAYEICSEVAERMGVGDVYTEGKTQEDWLREAVKATQEIYPSFPDYEDFKRDGVFRAEAPTVVPMRSFREDPEANPLPTPSGKIEIYSAELAANAKTWEFPDAEEGDRIVALPEYVPTWEGAEEAKVNSKYPLQAISYHFKGRTHSSYGNVAWLKEAHNHVVWINPIDAEARGIAHGDLVAVFNDRGRTKIEAKVTARIHPGVISIPTGAWFEPSKDGVDEGGSVNAITKYHPTPLAKSNPQVTNLVEIEKV